MEHTTLRWGIAGAGAIARRFCHDVNQFATAGRVVAIAARDARRAADFASQQALPHAFGSYLALAESPEVDAVYVATIHPEHAAIARLMLEHGKHVLVEKPAVLRVADWDELVALAHRRGVLLMEAMKVMCFPAWRALWEQLPALAPVRRVRAAFGSCAEPGGKLFDPMLAGGAGWDVGVYGVWLYVALCHRLGLDCPVPRTELSRGPSGVDEQCRFYFDGALGGEIGASIVAELDKAAHLEGDGWQLEIAGKWWNPQQVRWWGETAGEIARPVEGGMQFQADHFAACVAAGLLDAPWVPQALSRQVIGILESALT
ncbi:MAG: Gfo/Idh/MocA family protein [Aeromonas sp.]